LAGWIGRAAAVFGGSAPPAPQSFQLQCDCGESLGGWRTETHQRLHCSACRQAHLVLPGNAYPVVKRNSVAPPLPKKKAADVISSDSGSSALKAAARKPADQSSKKARRTSESATESTAKVPVTATVPAVEKIDLSPTLQQGRRRRQRLRLIIVSILGLVGVTGWSLWNRAVREQARATIPVASKTGIEALHAGDFVTAKRELGRAVAGLNTLGWNDAAALTIRQAHREAVAGEGLSSTGLMELATDFLNVPGEPLENSRRFQDEHGARWLLFDAGLSRRSQGGETWFVFDVPLVAGNRTLQIACDFPELRRVSTDVSNELTQRVIFAAQIEEWQGLETTTQPVVARLRSGTAFVWTDYQSYLAAGYRPESPEAEAETRGILSDQRQQVSTP